MIWWLTLTGFPLWWLTSLSLVAGNFVADNLWCKYSEKSGACTVKRRDQLQLGQVIRSSLERLDLEVGIDDVIQFEDKPSSSG
jgi:hypothetical protein